MKIMIPVLLVGLLASCITKRYDVTGELKQWHAVTITFNGPVSSEAGQPNPFLDYRLNVTFTHQASGKTYKVPGFYAADGQAGQSGADRGRNWQVRFTPDQPGIWLFKASFRQGPGIALSSDSLAGHGIAFDGRQGGFDVQPSDKKIPDFRARGRLEYAGRHYLRFAGDSSWFLKAGAGSPENFLAYFEFDQTAATHRYQAHAGDWQAGDPLWQDVKGKNIIGAVNYLAAKGMNSIYLLAMNVLGDGKDVWPWINKDERYRFDVSKLEQWEMVFAHMESRGVLPHILLSEAENKNLFEWEELQAKGRGFADSRKLYYREMIARFAHHNALIWNLGEENNMPAGNNAASLEASYPNSDKQRRDFARYIRATDPYDHPIVVHNAGWDIFPPLYGNPDFMGASMQVHDPENVYDRTSEQVSNSRKAGRPWVVMMDENGHYTTGAVPDADDPGHDAMRTQVLWPHFMAGGAGVEWYFGYKYAHADLNCEDWRSRDRLWDQTRYAVEFFRDRMLFWKMTPTTERIMNGKGYVFSQQEKLHVLYLPQGGKVQFRLTEPGSYTVDWYNPRNGGPLRKGTIKQVRGAGVVSIGWPPEDVDRDWVVLLQNEENQ